MPEALHSRSEELDERRNCEPVWISTPLARGERVAAPIHSTIAQRPMPSSDVFLHTLNVVKAQRAYLKAQKNMGEVTERKL